MKHLIVGGLVAAGLCAAFFAGRVSVPEVAASASSAVDESGAAALERAQKRVADLEKRLAAARKPCARAGECREKEPAERSAEREGVAMTGGTNVDILAELKKNLSEEEFNKATNAMERLRARLAAKAKGRMGFLKSVDTSALTPGERDNHAKFIELIGRRESVRAKMKGGIPDQQTIQKLMEVELQMQPLAKLERATLSRELVRELGYVGDDADTICDAISDIFDCTTGGGMLDGVMDAAEGGAGVEVRTGVQVITM